MKFKKFLDDLNFGLSKISSRYTSRNEIARHTGVSLSQINAMYNDKRAVVLYDTVLNVADYFGKKPEDLF